MCDFLLNHSSKWIRMNKKGETMPRHRAPTIARDIGAQITNGTWTAGDLLPNERALAERYGVARNTIRNALDVLERNGLIARHVGRGTIVKSKPSDHLAGLIEKISGAAPIDILNLRIIIEPQAAASAAITAGSEELDTIAKVDWNTNAASSDEEFERWDNEFHSSIFRAARNQFLMDLHLILSIVRFQPHMMELRRRSFNDTARRHYAEQHARIVDCLKARDASGAAAAMRTHLIARKTVYFGDQ